MDTGGTPGTSSFFSISRNLQTPGASGHFGAPRSPPNCSADRVPASVYPTSKFETPRRAPPWVSPAAKIVAIFLFELLCLFPFYSSLLLLSPVLFFSVAAVFVSVIRSALPVQNHPLPPLGEIFFFWCYCFFTLILFVCLFVNSFFNAYRQKEVENSR